MGQIKVKILTILTHIVFSEAGQFVNNLDHFMTIWSTILGLFQNFSCLQKRENFNFLNFAETPLSLYLLIFNDILISQLKYFYYLLPSVSHPANFDNSAGFQ